MNFTSYIFCNTHLFIQMTLIILEKLLADIFEPLKPKTTHMYIIWWSNIFIIIMWLYYIILLKDMSGLFA